jgi:hypothetical protein
MDNRVQYVTMVTIIYVALEVNYGNNLISWHDTNWLVYKTHVSVGHVLSFWRSLVIIKGYVGPHLAEYSAIDTKDVLYPSGSMKYVRKNHQWNPLHRVYYCNASRQPYRNLVPQAWRVSFKTISSGFQQYCSSLSVVKVNKQLLLFCA